MKTFAFVMGSICMMLAYRDAQAQGFWYVPPGADYSYRYGLDLGDGLGFGYSFGFGYGNVASPEVATAAAYADLMRLQGGYYSVQSPAYFGDIEDAGDFEQPQLGTLVWQQYAAPTVEQMNAEKVVAAQNQKAQTNHVKQGSAVQVTHIEFNRKTGRVDWPSVLERDEFSVHRSEMETLLKILGKTGPTSEMKARISDKAQEMHDAMRRHYRKMSSKDYSEGQRFINRLATGIDKSVS